MSKWQSLCLRGKVRLLGEGKEKERMASAACVPGRVRSSNGPGRVRSATSAGQCLRGALGRLHIGKRTPLLLVKRKCLPPTRAVLDRRVVLDRRAQQTSYRRVKLAIFLPPVYR